MAARKRWRGTTTERGYGWDHVRKLRAARAAWKPGQLCTYCWQPIWHLYAYDARGRRISAVDLAHTPDRTGYEGLQHRYCNRREGASRGNRMRTAAGGWRTSRAW